MKRTLQLIKSGGALLTLLLISIVLPGSAWADEVTFDPSTNKGSLSAYKANTSDEVTVSPITIHATVGAFAIGTDYRCYTGSMTISTTNGNITKIEITCPSSGKNNDPSKFSLSSSAGTYSNSGKKGTWTGNASSITLKASAQVRMTSIVVTYSTKTATTLTLEPTTWEPTKVGDTKTLSATVKVKAGETTIDNPSITYTSSDEDVATVEDGVITAKGYGTATITATYAGDDTYDSSEATCTVTFTDPDAPSIIYKKITSADDIEAGETYIVVSETYNYAMGAKKSDEDYMSYVTVKLDNHTYSGDVNTDSTPYEITLEETSTDGCYNVKTKDGYLYSSSDASKNQTRIYVASTAGTTNAYLWTASYDDEKDHAALTTKVQTTRSILYSKDNSRYGLYMTSSASNSNYGVTSLYKKVETKKAETGTFSITTENYATFYSEDAFIMPEGVKGGIVTAASSNEDGTKTLTIDYRYTEGTTVPAKTALLLNGENNTYTYTKTTSTEEAPTGNYLHGADAVDSEGKTYVADNMYYYILTHDTDGNNYGFYWAASDGGAVTYHAPFAFLALDKSAGIKGFSLSDATTGITTVQTAAPANAAIYTLSGVRVNATSTNTLPAGIYIVGGKKVLVK